MSATTSSFWAKQAAREEAAKAEARAAAERAMDEHLSGECGYCGEWRPLMWGSCRECFDRWHAERAEKRDATEK